MSSKANQQKEFMRACEMFVSPKPAFNLAAAQLWGRLIKEEFEELEEAIARAAEARPQSLSALAEVTAEAVDLVYVVMGLCNSMGLPFDDMWKVIHRANMAKAEKVGCYRCGGTGLVPGTIFPTNEQPCPSCEGKGFIYEVKRREDGKILKPEGWKPADKEGVLNDAADAVQE